MIAKELLEILACPETRQPLRLAGEKELTAVNARIRAGGLRNRGSEEVTEPLEAGLVREDGKVLYPVLEDIPILLVEEGIELEGSAGDGPVDSGCGST